MLFKVPIVTSDIAGTRDLITHDENGFMCPVGDYKCFAECITKLLNDEELTNRFVEKGFEKVKKEFSWEKNIKKFKCLYNLV
jgi:glycosyltransferase involved in cell wall biosynthesis